MNASNMHLCMLDIYYVCLVTFLCVCSTFLIIVLQELFAGKHHIQQMWKVWHQ